MKRLLQLLHVTIFAMLFACDGDAQVDLSKLTEEQWRKDLNSMVDRIDKSFAGFTTETKASFHSETERFRESLAGMNTTQRILGLAKLLVLLKDGHTELSLTGTASGFRRFPLTLYYFGNDLRVVSAGKSLEKLLGLRLTKIDGMTVETALEKLKPLMNCDNDIEYVTTAPYLFIVPEILHASGISRAEAEVTLTLASEAGEIEHVIKAISLEEYNKAEFVKVYKKAPLYLENPERDYWYKFLPDSKTMYICVKSMIDEDGQPSLKKMIKGAFAEVDKLHPDKLVFDVRLCRGGNYNNATPIIDELQKRPEINKEGKLFIVNGRLTFSAAAVTTVLMRDKTKAMIIGEVSRARPNWAENMESYYLPNSRLKFDCTDELKVHSERLRNSDKIPVDIPINRTFENYQSGRDEVMEYVESH